MRKAGRVTFADILKDRDGEGYIYINFVIRWIIFVCLTWLLFISVVEFSRRDDMKYALKELDNEKLNGSRVTLEEAVSQ
jgi:arginine/serine-rich splicing factor 4/5/6